MEDLNAPGSHRRAPVGIILNRGVDTFFAGHEADSGWRFIRICVIMAAVMLAHIYHA
jgi:hypothetical protein